MESKDKCEAVISVFNGKLLPSCKEPLLVKFADGGNKKKNQYKSQDPRWREGEVSEWFELVQSRQSNLMIQ